MTKEDKNGVTPLTRKGNGEPAYDPERVFLTSRHTHLTQQDAYQTTSSLTLETKCRINRLMRNAAIRALSNFASFRC
jgi:hypothetical protein